MSKITAKQIRAARVLIHMTQEQLAQEANISVNTLMIIETGRAKPSDMYAAALKVVLERHNVEFLPDEKARLRPPHISTDPYSYY